MSVAVYPSEMIGSHTSAADALAGVRVVGGAAVAFKTSHGSTRIASLQEHGGYRIKFPVPTGAAIEAVVVNTGGGVVGGDRVGFDIITGSGAQAIVTATSAERIYRSTGAASRIDVQLRAGDGATLAWLPQATILYSGARLNRRFEVDLAADARFVMAELTIFGRTASGEVMGTGLLHDIWRIRRDDQLIFAEATRLDGDIAALLARPAVAAGVNGTALLVCVAPHAADRRDAVRTALQGHDVLAGASAWNGMLVVRALASRLDVLQSALRHAIEALQIPGIPRVWAH